MNNMNQQQPQQQNVQVNLSNSTAIKCEKCGYDVFLPAVKMRKISKILTGGAQDAILPIDILVCGECGAVCEELLPREIKALEEQGK